MIFNGRLFMENWVKEFKLFVSGVLNIQVFITLSPDVMFV